MESVVALAAACRSFRSVLADDAVGFWKRIASEVWGVVGVDAPGAQPRIPGGAGAGAPASSWKESCVAHSVLLSRFGDAGRRAARAWHRIEAALAEVAPEVLTTLSPGRTLSEQEPREEEEAEGGGERTHVEILAAAAIHNGQDFFATALPEELPSLQHTRRSQLGLFGSAVIYGEGYSRWMRALLPRAPGAKRSPPPCRCLASPVAGASGEEDRAPKTVLLHDLSVSLPAPFPHGELRSAEGWHRLALSLESAAVFVRCPSPGGRVPLDPVKRADGGGGLLSYLAELAAALETRQLGPERDSFFRSGARQVPLLDADARRTALTLYPRTRGISSFAAAPPGLASCEAAGGALVSRRSFLYTWLPEAVTTRRRPGSEPVQSTSEMHVFSYRISFRLLSVAEQRRRFRLQRTQLGGGAGGGAGGALHHRVVLRATLVSRHWEVSSAWRGGEVQVIDGEGAVGFTPTLIAQDGGDDDDDDGGGQGENDDVDDDDPSYFCYCSRVEAPPHFDGPDPPVGDLHPPGQRLGSFGGHFIFRAEFDDGAAADVVVPVAPIEMVVPSVFF